MASVTLIPSGYIGLSGMSIDSGYPINNAYANSSSTNYARFNVNQSTTGEVYLTFDTSSIPASATNISITGNFKARVSSTTRITNTGARLYAGTTAKGSSVAFASTTASVRSLTPGSSWTRSDLNDLRLYVTGRASSSTSSRRIDFYGADVTITYTAEDIHPTSVSLDEHTLTLEEGETAQLTETVLPANATDKSVSWSTSNSSVATVVGGLVTAISAGSATITVTTNDGGKTDSCAVTVTQPTYSEWTVASTMEVGQTYLVASGNSGSVYLLTNEANGARTLKGQSVTVSGGKIQLRGSLESKCVFTCTQTVAGNSVTTTLEESGGKYLYCDNSSGLRFQSTSNLDRFWHYIGTKFWQFKSAASDGYTDTSSEYKYYLELNNGNFTDNHTTTTSIEASTLPAIYLFKPYSGQTETLYYKENGSWISASKAYKKVNGSWVEQSDLTNVFQSGTNYVKGN